ncbi:vWA domain-containing protein [Winogradskyella alexanderae]|uniref:VWA domain-containing protein n=1 Tax=Winogradskyella alexanderae TaxID=2877123 RepID=A0ABS7XTF3_9FLAO|nr:vWA domain-containing protein [Winogradskyella alexanderae]MCA0132713.1 VWA domain-containing protein [Winogradskyella alexanderae]
MQIESILYIIIAGIAALLIALFQYVYKSKIKRGIKYYLLFLRALSVFGLLLLLINPKFESNTFYNEKPQLVLAIDNSESISYLNQDSTVNEIVSYITGNEQLNKRFDVNRYTFSNELRENDSLSFSGAQTNISSVLRQLGEVYKDKTAPIILFSDGNQTIGRDYSYMANTVKQSIYPLILGDSVVFSDLKIEQLNINRFTFLKNKFPIEVILSYSGETFVNTEFRIWNGDRIVYRKPVSFSENKSSEIVVTSLVANSVGIKTYRAEIVPITQEKNTVNNYQNFAVEVIDQKTNVAIVSDQLHPDLGVLKKAIQSNEQRSASILKPNEYLSQIDDYQLVILYQPNSNFRSLLNEVKTQKLNTFIITGASTDYEFINDTNLKVIWGITNQTEEFQPELNRNYNTFIIDNITFENYPPLKSEFGGFNFLAPADIILYKTVNGISTGDAMLATYSFDDMKHAVLVGEGIWRWRAQTYLDKESFNDFDNFIGKLIQYLSSTKKRNRLNIDYKSFYNGNDNIIISAQYFNENFEFDSKASLILLIENSENGKKRELPLLLNGSQYTVDLSGIEAGSYNFTVKHSSEPISSSGRIQVLEYNVEQQFLNADLSRLNKLAKDSGGKAFFANNSSELIDGLLSDNRYRTIQKSTKNIVPLIDWKYLLGFIALCLFSEWFIRKYNGLI